MRISKAVDVAGQRAAIRPTNIFDFDDTIERAARLTLPSFPADRSWPALRSILLINICIAYKLGTSYLFGHKVDESGVLKWVVGATARLVGCERSWLNWDSGKMQEFLQLTKNSLSRKRLVGPKSVTVNNYTSLEDLDEYIIPSRLIEFTRTAKISCTNVACCSVGLQCKSSVRGVQLVVPRSMDLESLVDNILNAVCSFT
jgi:hypothetical protein